MLHPTIRRSPYFERTLAAGADDFMVYNHTYMPMGYGRDPREDYDALVERVTLWDVGAERQAELRGPDALALADHLAPRRLSDLGVGECRYTPVCDRDGQVMCECVVLRPWADVVWFSHSDCDFSLWAAGIALARGDAVRVREADVAPMQLQGPRAAAVMAAVAGEAVAGIDRFRCVEATLAGVACVVSNTGWSREPGYEIYPLGSDRAPNVWDALVAAGEPHRLLVTGPNIVRAVEQGISDTQYATNSAMNPIEMGLAGLLDLDRDFVGAEALRAVRDRGPARRIVGLVCDGPPFPAMERHWPVATASGGAAGVARWAVHSFALGRNIVVALIDAGLDASGLIVQAADGPRRAEPHPIPSSEPRRLREMATETVRLTELSHGAGCACKLPAGSLREVLAGMTQTRAPELLVGNESLDDAAVWRVSDELAVVQTIDFFTPLVDDPYTFGRIAATNAFSDIYAMGARPAFALNVVAFPKTLSMGILGEILRGGADVAAAAGAVVAGGHSIDDAEPKYGMAVTGFARPDEVWTNSGGRAGDVLVLSKPIGTGIVTTAVKRGDPDPDVVAAAVESMTTLNAEAASLVRAARPHAVTDVTGFGLVGHARELAAGAGLVAEIDWGAVRLLPGVRELIAAGHVPGGTRTNLELAADYAELGPGLDEADRLLACDAQTSGGLFASLPAERAAALPWPVIGRLADGPAGTVVVR